MGLRSGLLEILALSGVEIVSIYTKLPQRGLLNEMPASEVLNGFSMKQLPGIDCTNIFEFTENNNYHELLESICRRLL